MTLIAQIDESLCLGHGDCVHVAPGVFILEGDVAEQQAQGTENQLRQAARACPAGRARYWAGVSSRWRRSRCWPGCSPSASHPASARS